MKKINLLIIVALSISLMGCGQIKQKEVIIPDVELNMQYEYDTFKDAITYIINNGNANSEKINAIDGLISNNVKNNILNCAYNNNTYAELINSYRSEDTIFLQVKNNEIYYLYKLEVRNNIISNCVIYENLN